MSSGLGRVHGGGGGGSTATPTLHSFNDHFSERVSVAAVESDGPSAHKKKKRKEKKNTSDVNAERSDRKNTREPEESIFIFLPLGVAGGVNLGSVSREPSVSHSRLLHLR